MDRVRTRRAEQAEGTRAALIDAGRALFAERGFADVGTEEIVRAAGVTRGALYHQFADKTELFAAVFEAVETDTSERIQAAVGGGADVDPITAMQLGTAAFLDICADPAMARIMLVEGPGGAGGPP